MNGPWRLHPIRRREPLFGRDATRRIEQASQAALPPFTLMSRAGEAVARLARAIAPHAGRVWIAAGPGNNGGDGLEAAVRLHEAGVPVEVTLLADPARLPADARLAHQHALAAGVPIGAGAPPSLGPRDLAIDALLGVGATRAPAGDLAALVRHLGAQPCAVLAIDLPSGLDADTGQPLGPDAAHATHTLSLLSLKPGLFTGAGRDHAGEVWFDDLAADPGAEPATAWLPAPATAAPRRHAQHKGSFGDVLVTGGSHGMAGAAVLAARAAHAAGAGRVHVDLLDDTALAHDLVRPELMFRPADRRAALPVSATVVAGCGGGDDIATALPHLLDEAERLVLDADALNAVARDPALQGALAGRAARARFTVLTPHPLEAARLLGTDTATVQADRLAAARQLARRFACVVVLKGSGSIVATPDEAPTVNPTGNAALATAGTGDVLAGWIGGLWAAHGLTAREAAERGVWQHGEAADRSPRTPLRAADLVEALHALSHR